MAEMVTEQDSELKVWMLTGFRSGFLVFGDGSGFGVNFSDSAHDGHRAGFGVKSLDANRFRSQFF